MVKSSLRISKRSPDGAAISGEMVRPRISLRSCGLLAAAFHAMTKNHSQRSILDQMVDTSVSFNGLMIPASALCSTLSRYVDNLVVWNDHQTYKVSLVGSAVPIRFAGRYFLLCTNHQLRCCQKEDVSLLGRDGRNLVTSSGVRHFNDESNPHYRDLAAFDSPKRARRSQT